MTIRDLADRIHKSRSTVSKYETGEISLDMVTLFHIAAVLQVSPNQLIDYQIPGTGGGTTCGPAPSSVL